MRNNYLKKYMLLFALLLVSGVIFAQSRSITGKVVDENNQSLPGATVSITGTTMAGSTDVNGVFKINGVKAGTYTVSATFIGYNAATKTVTVGGSDVTVDFNLVPSSKSLNEIVVIGYGTARKKDLTGSVTTVGSKDFQTGNITSPEQLIAGKVAGVTITSNGGAPGAGSTIRVRGGASLSATNDPLIVIDGVQLSGDAIPGAPSPLSLINPNDIETFTVLKDASATAIYGSRASNGVIIITTKKGTSGKPQVNLNSQVSVSKLIKEVSVLSADQLRDYVKTNGSTQYVGYLGTANTDWQKEIYQTAVSNDNNLSVSGTTGKMPYRVSVGFLDQQGILKTGHLYRTSAGLNLSPRFLDDHLKLDLNVRGSLSRARFANMDAVGAAVSFDPTQPVYSGNNNYGGYYEYLDASSATGEKVLAPRNPVGLLQQKFDGSDVKRSIGNAQLDYKFHFLPDLHANVNFGYDISEGKGTIVIPPTAGSSFNRFKDANNVLHSGVNNQYRNTQVNTTFEAYLNYTKDIKSINSRIEAVGGYAYYDYLTTAYNFPDLTSDGTVVSTPTYPYNKPEHRLLSYYGRLVYTFADKYILTGTIRSDGSSRFSPLNRYAVFPSAAFAWRLKEESFLKDNTVLSDLKLRVGYGTTGQQDGPNIENYAYQSYYALSSQTASYQFGSNFYQLYRPAAYDPKRKWEQSATTNVAVDFGFLNGRLTGSIDAYYKNTKDLLGIVNAPAGSSFSNQYVTNVGSMVNRGIEVSLNAQVVRSKDLNWDVALNTTYNENKITKLTITDDPNGVGQATGGVSGGTGTNVQRYFVGAPRSAFYVYQQVYDVNGKPMDGVFVDRNKDGIINDKDLYLYKQPDPKFIFGFSTNVSYKQWTLGTVLRANLGNYAYNNVYSSTGIRNNILNPLGYLNNGSTNVLESGLSGAGDKSILSDYYVQNASFLKMDNASLGYNFGKLFHSSTNISLNANVQNVFTITNYKGVDPEIGSGIDNNLYPRPRTFTLGVNVKF